jgi:hypothetical protein
LKKRRKTFVYFAEVVAFLAFAAAVFAFGFGLAPVFFAPVAVFLAPVEVFFGAALFFFSAPSFDAEAVATFVAGAAFFAFGVVVFFALAAPSPAATAAFFVAFFGAAVEAFVAVCFLATTPSTFFALVVVFLAEVVAFVFSPSEAAAAVFFVDFLAVVFFSASFLTFQDPLTFDNLPLVTARFKAAFK